MGHNDLSLSVAKLASNGEGIAFQEGKAVFIPFVIPGERILCHIVSEHADYARAQLIEVVEPSPHRVEPACPLFGECGGCSLQHIAYDHQVSLKAGDFPESLPIKSSPYGYRNRARFHIAQGGGIGFKRNASEETIKVTSCPVLVDSINKWLKPLNRKAHPERELQALIGARNEFSVFGQKERFYLEGRDAIATAELGGREYRFPVSHFFQSNLQAASELAAAAVQGLSGDRVADLYCGAGLFSAPLAEHFDTIDCVESDTVSLEAARANVKSKKARFHAQNVERWVDKTKASGERFDWILVDPPRTGLSAVVRSWLASHPPRQGLVYVSCDKATFIRDRNELVKAGWKSFSAQLFDFYPQTGRVELLARFAPPNPGGTL